MMLKSLRTTLALAACVGTAYPAGAEAAEPVLAVKDVALRQGGLLVGQVVDQQGISRAGSVVSIQQNSQEIVRAQTDANGVFAAQGLRGGQYQLVADDGQSFCRLWAADTAPPAAATSAVVVTGENVVRGQWVQHQHNSMGGGYGGRWLDWVRSHPYITAGIVAAAIATPLAIAASQDDGGSTVGSGPSS